MQALLDQYGLALVFANVLVLSLGLPIPAMPTLILVGAGFALQGGVEGWLGCLAALLLSVAASVIGDLAWYWAGRRYGGRTLRSLCRVSLSRDSCMKKSERFYGRLGIRVLLIAKFVPGLSMVSVPMVGAMGVPVRTFVRWEAAGAALWAVAGIGLGALFCDQLGQLDAILAQLGSDALVLVAGLLLAYLGWRCWSRYSLRRTLEVARIGVHDLYQQLSQEPAPVVLDIRGPGYRNLDPYTIPGAVAADERELATLLATYPPERNIVVFCSCPGEVSAAWLATQLRQHRYGNVHPLRGGLAAWREAGYEVVELDLPAAAAPAVAAVA